MLGYFRKWSLALKRRRLRKEQAKLEGYKAIEENVREGAGRCYNCAAPLTGPFCHICGQRDDDLRRPIWAFFRELLDAVFDTDGKIIKSLLTLVMMPGGLSRGFNEGRRARYLPPFRLYVVLLFTFFFATNNIADVLILDIHVQPKEEMVIEREAAEAARQAAIEAEETARQVALEAAQEQRERIHEARESLADMHRSVAEMQQEIAEMSGNGPDLVLKQKILQELIEDTARFEEQMVQEERRNVADVTRQTAADIAAQGVTVLPAPPVPPSLIEAIERVEQGYNEGGAELQGVLDGLMQNIAEGTDDEKGLRIREAQERVRELLASPDNNFSAGDREALEGVLAMDVEAIERQIAFSQRDSDSFSLGSLPYDFNLAMFVPNDNETREGIKQEDLEYIMHDPKVPPMVKKATEGLLEALKSPREFNKLFNEWLPYAMVFLLPVFAFILRIFHWGKRRYYLNQLIFALHFHSFLFVMLTIFAFVLPSRGGDGAFDIFWMVSSLYLIIALKVGQDQGWIRAFLKAGFIWVSYFFIMMATLAVIMFMGLSDSSLGEMYDQIHSAHEKIHNHGGAETPTIPDQ